jgi:hypothetical protein
MNFTTMSEIKPVDEHALWSVAVSTHTNDAFVTLDSNVLLNDGQRKHIRTGILLNVGILKNFYKILIKVFE